ncbi:substrate-binding domain-containing protein [Actinomadura nitritigenes]|uniref:substrate-binding domain-containing protein n=1 Tax=Actinomadura nitritigenes TaxID=134602 RepID=UPI003D8BE39D
MLRWLHGAHPGARRARWLAAVAAVLAAATGCTASLAAQTPVGSKKHSGDYVIALSNSFLGNSWRQTMVKVFQRTAGDAKRQGLISGYKVSNTSQNTATEQIAQMKALILQGVDAIVVDSASPTALNPTITQACRAGIVVVVFDSLASAPCEYDLSDDMAEYGRTEAEIVSRSLGGRGDVILSRGLVGSGPEKIIYDAQRKELARHPGIKVASTVIGNSAEADTQQAVQNVLPSLGKVSGVLTGGSSLGAVRAFQNAHRPVPAVAFENTGEALREWQRLHDQTGYSTGSVRSEPGQAAAAFWTALDVLSGRRVPKHLAFPTLQIGQEDLADWIRVTPNGNVATWLWTREQTRAVIAAQGGALPRPPIPSEAP